VGVYAVLAPGSGRLYYFDTRQPGSCIATLAYLTRRIIFCAHDPLQWKCFLVVLGIVRTLGKHLLVSPFFICIIVFTMTFSLSSAMSALRPHTPGAATPLPTPTKRGPKGVPPECNNAGNRRSCAPAAAPLFAISVSSPHACPLHMPIPRCPHRTQSHHDTLTVPALSFPIITMLGAGGGGLRGWWSG